MPVSRQARSLKPRDEGRAIIGKDGERFTILDVDNHPGLSVKVLAQTETGHLPTLVFAPTDTITVSGVDQ